jgi:hypothetical protein
MNTNKVSIKITAQEQPLLKTLEILESIFPLSVRSKVMQNDDGINSRCWLTVAVEAHPQSQPQTATTTHTKQLVEALLNE